MICKARIKEQTNINLFTPFLASWSFLSISPREILNKGLREEYSWCQQMCSTNIFFSLKLSLVIVELYSPPLLGEDQSGTRTNLTRVPELEVIQLDWLKMWHTNYRSRFFRLLHGPSVRMTTWMRTEWMRREWRPWLFPLDRKSISNRKYLLSGDERYWVRL